MLACWPWIGPSLRLATHLEDIPHVLGRMAELTARNAGTEVELTNRDAVVLDVVGKVVVALGHGTNKHGNALALVEASNVVAHSHNLRVKAERYLSAVWW